MTKDTMPEREHHKTGHRRNKPLKTAVDPFSLVDLFSFGNEIDRHWNAQSGDYTVSGGTATAFNNPSTRNVAVLNGVSVANSTQSVTVTNLLSGQLAELVAAYQGPGDTNMYQGGNFAPYPTNGFGQ